MDLDDLTPAGAGSLRSYSPPASERVATFTPTRAVHPDAHWSPRGGELEQRSAPAPAHLNAVQFGQHAGDSFSHGGPLDTSDHAGDSEFDLEAASARIRGALRGGAV